MPVYDEKTSDTSYLSLSNCIFMKSFSIFMLNQILFEDMCQHYYCMY
jgi:hypothetical protein